MSSSSRDGSCDRSDRSDSLVLKHQHSFSESGRASIPMWDSSDPDRAPPPLPLNPGSSNSPATRPNTSARIEEAAALIAARARENAPSSYTTSQTSYGSPEKSPTKPQNKRMQSIQGGTVGRLSDSLERRSPEKGLRTPRISESEEQRASRSPERSPTRSGSETPTPSGRLTPSHLNRPILGENTPPSATMLALQTIRNRQEAEAPLSNITNGVIASSRPSQTYDAISTQILSLTSIATNLQREMAQLSRRSKDNATDLISLKEATNSRDEDIRKSLRELVNGLDHRFTNLDTKLLTAPEASRSTPNLGLYLDSKAHNDSPGRKSVVLPRIPSPMSFSAAMDRDMTASPSLRSSEGAASIALLEKVLREMGTKEGQEMIIATLESVKQRTQITTHAPQRFVDPTLMKKLDEILINLKDFTDSSNSRALVKASGGGIGNVPAPVDLYFDEGVHAGPLARARGNGQNSEFVNEEVMKMLKNVKQSLSQGGGLTNEVKALVRELRGEVLGMGREIARKLEQAESTRSSAGKDARGPGRDEIACIVQEGLAELKEQMHHIVRENRRQSAGSTRSMVDTQEVIHAVRSALAEMPRPRDVPVHDPQQEREELLASIREAWEDCKPEIALEHFGLERDEILDTLKEGLKSYQSPDKNQNDDSVTYSGVIEAVQQALADFKPPSIETEASLTREEILVTVRECLESFEFPMPIHAPSQAREVDLSREDVLAAVKDGFELQAPVTKEVEFNRSDLFAAVKASLQGEENPLGVMGERVLGAMHDFLGSMKKEFQQYSAANGKDTEQVLDAMKDGLEELRADIETYVDRAADVTGKDEIIDTVKAGFAAMQGDLNQGFAGQGSKRSNVQAPELLDAMEKEFEHLRDSITKTLARTGELSDKEEILDAIRDMGDDRQSSLSSNSEDIVRLVKEELEHMRTALAGTLVRGESSVAREEVLDAIREGLNSGPSPRKLDGGESILSNTSELLDAFQEGVDGIRSDMQKLMNRPVDLSTSYEILDTLKAGLDNVRADIVRLHEKQSDVADSVGARGREVVVHDENLISTEIEGLKVMITQLRIKVEALDTMSVPQPPMPSQVHIHKDDLAEVHAAIKEVHYSVNNVRSAQEVPLSSNTASKEDTDAIETLLRNVKARLEEFSSADIEGAAKTVHLDSIEDLLKDMKVTLDDTAARTDSQAVSKDDFTMVELLLKEIATGVDELQTKVKSIGNGVAHVTKADIQAVETLCLDTKTQIEELALPDPRIMATKEDVLSITDTIKAVHEQIETDNELTAQAFEARKVEHGGLATKMDDVKDVLADLRDELLEKLENGADGVTQVQKLLRDHHDAMGTYATAQSMAELSDMMSKGLACQLEHHERSKVENEDRAATLFNKHDETGVELKSKIEDKFNELMTKYDDAQSSNAAKLQAFETRDGQNLQAMNGTKAVVDDLRLLIETLGMTVTETCDRMTEDTKTLFTGVEAANAKVGELQISSAREHGLTREDVARTLAAASRLETSINEHQPTMLAGIREVLGIVNQHFEHSQQQTEHFSRATEEIKMEMNALPSSIQPLLPAPTSPTPPTLFREVPMQKEYDDSQLHAKLNNLIAHTSIAKEAFATIDTHHKNTQESLSQIEKLEKLDKIDDIHNQVMATADELSTMVANHTRLLTEHHDSKAMEATEAAIALEKRTAQKEKVEADIVALSEQKEDLVRSMAALKREHEELHGQTKRLTREVAKLETALKIRQEEMKDMDARAGHLERRILEGVMNHARSVNISKPSTRTRITPAQRDASMNLKRVPSSASTATAKTSTKDGSSTIGSTVGMALKRRSPLTSASPSNISSRSSGVERRILSTSHVTGNRSRDAPDRALMLAPAPNTGLVSLKRSHSVKSNPSSYLGDRKATWNGDAHAIEDKENLVLDEHREAEESDSNVDGSEADTEKRTSFSGTSYMYTDSMTYGTGSSRSTNGARTLSYASSVGGAVGGKTESIVEVAEEAEEDANGGLQPLGVKDDQDQQSAEIMALLDAPPDMVNGGQDNSMAMTAFDDGLETPAVGYDGMSDLQPPRLQADGAVKYNGGSDSGLGTEPPTANLEHGAAWEYFNMTAQEMNQGA